MADRAAETPQVFTRAQARAAGLSNRQLDRQLASGKVIALRRGVLHRPEPETGLTAEAASAYRPLVSIAVPLEVKAALAGSPGRRLVISHASAAQLWGLPKPVDGWSYPQFTAVGGASRRRRGLHVRVAPMAEHDVVEIAGFEVTSPSRTVADCLRSLSGRDSLAMLDAALRSGVVTDQAVLDVLHRQSGWPGVGRARQVLALGDPRRESPLESWSTWAFAHTGVPNPQWQVDVRGPDGRQLGRVDCWWSMAALIGEADGRSKYLLATAERGGSAEALLDVLQAERRREQRVRDVGADVIRWSAKDVLSEPAARRLATRILAGLMVGRESHRFSGVVVPALRPPATVVEPDSPSTG